MTTEVMTLVNDLISQQRWDEAYSMLSRYAAQQPNDPQMQYELGVLCSTWVAMPMPRCI